MSPDQLREALSRLGWSQTRAAEELQVQPRLMRYWCAGAKPIPRVVGMALAALVENAPVQD